MLADGADVIHSGGHNEGCEFELTTGSHLARGVAADGVAAGEVLDHFPYGVDIHRFGELRQAQQVFHHQTLQDGNT